MQDLIPKIYTEDLTFIYKCLYNRDYKNAEKALLAVINKILCISHSDKEDIIDSLIVTNIICNDFNEYYLKWVEDMGGEQKEEIITLYSSDKPENYLLSHCSDCEGMDNLFYELLNYLLNNCQPRYKIEIQSQIEGYEKKLIVNSSKPV